jgi:hypothetical protein
VRRGGRLAPVMTLDNGACRRAISDQFPGVARLPEILRQVYLLAGREMDEGTMDRFVARLNIEKFRKRLEVETDDAKRQTLLRLLDEELAKLATAENLPQKKRRQR